MLDVKSIITFFVRQFVTTDQKIPEGGAFDMVDIAHTDPVAKLKFKIDPDSVESLVNTPTDQYPTDFDEDLETLGMD